MGFLFSKAGTACSIGLGALALAACQGTTNVGGADGGSGGSGGTGTGGAGGSVPLGPVDKVDILLGIDNSRSMADKQEVLALALSDLVQSLTNPPCLYENGDYASPQPSNHLEPCPDGSERRYPPVLDIHLGIISSSIGGHGSDACSVAQSPSNDDRGHLLARSAPGQVDDIPTYEGKGFLLWDPAAKYTPPGEADAAAVAATFKDMVLGVGQIGCGYESQLESWYRFLAEPEPYETISVVNGVATPQGIDSVLLQQRADFLRPDSMLVVLMLTDENDCSIRESLQYYYAAQQANPNGSAFRLPRPRSECATNPNDPCCLSCGQAQGSCPVDPTCYVAGDPNQGVLALTDIEDTTNLRCFDQKRRFGIDFLYPIDRYVQALTQTQVANRSGQLVPNPIFSDLNPNDEYTNIRDPGLVVLAGIVGVPWQEIARDPANPALGFKSAQELSASGTWDAILGDPANHVPPASPFMVESIDPRAGIADPNPINGSEWTITGRNDLQYACIFPLPAGAERDCSQPGAPACDCEAGTDNPLCAPNPNDGGNLTLQVGAKAYPGIRHLSVLKGLGDQGVTGSICPVQLTDTTAGDYAYRPTIRSLIDRMATRL
jgi:hypothetical protein